MLLVKKYYLLAHYIVTFRNSRSFIVTNKRSLLVRHTSHVITFCASRYVSYKQVSASGFPRHPLLSYVYVIEITTLARASRVTRTRNIIRDSVQSTAGLLK